MSRFGALWIDARIPVAFGGLPAAGDAVMVEGGTVPPDGVAVERFHPDAAHPAGCACCTARPDAARALDRLFLARVRGTAPFFRRVRVIAGAAGEESVRAALATDPTASARFRV